MSYFHYKNRPVVGNNTFFRSFNIVIYLSRYNEHWNLLTYILILLLCYEIYRFSLLICFISSIPLWFIFVYDLALKHIVRGNILLYSYLLTSLGKTTTWDSSVDNNGGNFTSFEWWIINSGPDICVFQYGDLDSIHPQNNILLFILFAQTIPYDGFFFILSHPPDHFHLVTTQLPFYQVPFCFTARHLFLFLRWSV